MVQECTNQVTWLFPLLNKLFIDQKSPLKEKNNDECKEHKTISLSTLHKNVDIRNESMT